MKQHSSSVQPNQCVSTKRRKCRRSYELRCFNVAIFDRCGLAAGPDDSLAIIVSGAFPAAVCSMSEWFYTDGASRSACWPPPHLVHINIAHALTYSSLLWLSKLRQPRQKAWQIRRVYRFLLFWDTKLQVASWKAVYTIQSDLTTEAQRFIFLANTCTLLDPVLVMMTAWTPTY